MNVGFYLLKDSDLPDLQSGLWGEDFLGARASPQKAFGTLMNQEPVSLALGATRTVARAPGR